MSLPIIPKYARFGVLLLLAFYAALRIAALPADGSVAGGFGHDSAYTAIVASQVRDGHGYINPASWLVFLNPPDLPMPFHNANPGYLTLIAAISRVSGADVVWSGFLVSALSNLFLAAAVFWLVLPLSGSRAFAVFCAVFTALFPVHLADSLSYLPDALSTALTITCFALLVRTRFVLAGCVLGLAWLSRSTTILYVPGILVYLFWKLGRRRALSASAGLLLAALLVASPWLVHLARVWGSPFRSDATVYLLQNYYAFKQGHGDVEKYWRSLTPPPPLSEVLRTDAWGLLKYAVRGIPTMIYYTLYGWTYAWKPMALLLAILVGLGFLWSRRLLRTAEGAGAFVVCLTTFGAFCVRAGSIEIRYLGPCTVLLFLWPLAALLPWFRRGFARPNWAEGTTAVTAALLLLVASPVQDWTVVRTMRGPLEDTVKRRALDVQVNECYARGARVVVFQPYFYTWYTGASALSIPYAGKNDLIAYMRRYRAPFLLLEKSSADIRDAALLPELRVRADLGSHVLLELGPVP